VNPSAPLGQRQPSAGRQGGDGREGFSKTLALQKSHLQKRCLSAPRATRYITLDEILEIDTRDKCN